MRDNDGEAVYRWGIWFRGANIICTNTIDSPKHFPRILGRVMILDPGVRAVGKGVMVLHVVANLHFPNGALLLHYEWYVSENPTINPSFSKHVERLFGLF